MTVGRLRVLLVTDRLADLSPLRRILDSMPELEVRITSANPRLVVDTVRRLQPHVVCLDVLRLDVEALAITQRLMEHEPRPILVFTEPSAVEAKVEKTFAVLEAGALDLVRRPSAMLPHEEAAGEILTAVRVAAGVRVFRRRASSAKPLHPEPTPAPRRRPRLVVIGASTGGPPALAEILGAFPRDFPLPILCIQHISPGFLHGFAEWLDRHCKLRVKQAEDGEIPVPGTVYLPQEETHLVLDETHRLRHSRDPPVDGHRPSVTTTMRSAAGRHGGAVIGVLLTGMGRDGADGMAEIFRMGGITIAQDERTSTVFGMPYQAITAGVVRHVLPLEDIAARIIQEASVDAP